MFPVRFVKPALLSGLIALSLVLGGCVYFNTYFNAQKAYHQALSMREKRFSKNPEDSVVVTPEEKAKFERAIAKCSKLLELYPNRLDYAPKALFLMGESYLLMEDYSSAVEKYDELARYYPQAPQNPIAEVHRAKALYLGNQTIKARIAVQEILKRNPKGEILREALLLAARMEVEGDSTAAGLAYYEKLLQEKNLTTETRANLHWEAAKLAYQIQQWERARFHALSSERSALPDKFQFRNERMGILCRYGGKQFNEGIDDAKKAYKKKAFVVFRPELKLLMGRGREGLNDWKAAEKLFREVPKMGPRTAVAAEAYYRIGDHFLRVVRQQDSARVYFDSAAASGRNFEYGALADERSKALTRIESLRKEKPDSLLPQYQNFMIAELFLFNLDEVDSALTRLDQIVQSPVSDSVHTIRAAYARAYIHEEFKKNKPKADSLYHYVLEKFPNTEWAKQAEKNLGLPPTVLTDEDRAHALFLDAENLRFAGEDVSSKVVPAYRKVYGSYPRTREAAKALFVMGFLRDEQAHQTPPVKGSLDSAKVAYHNLRTNYASTVYGRIAAEKMEKVNITLDTTATPAKDSTATAAAPLPEAPVEISPDDSTQEATPHKEVLEPKYDNIDQY
jgi:TolA-binding protein